MFAILGILNAIKVVKRDTKAIEVNLVDQSLSFKKI